MDIVMWIMFSISHRCSLWCTYRCRVHTKLTYTSVSIYCWQFCTLSQFSAFILSIPSCNMHLSDRNFKAYLKKKKQANLSKPTLQTLAISVKSSCLYALAIYTLSCICIWIYSYGNRSMLSSDLLSSFLNSFTEWFLILKKHIIFHN